jgi:hypothetical protein
MYNYDFNNELVIYEIDNALIEINNQFFRGNILLTDKNLLLFRNISDFMKQKSQGVFVLPKYELVYKGEVVNLKYEIEENNSYINNDEVILYEINIEEIIQKKAT